jgi:hypothetical protein
MIDAYFNLKEGANLIPVSKPYLNKFRINPQEVL